VEEVVRQSVEETLNGLLDAEADELCGAKRYERSVERFARQPTERPRTWWPNWRP
jgi:transposase-like protein